MSTDPQMRSTVTSLLSRQLFAVLSTYGEEGLHSVIVSFVADDSGEHIVFSTPRKTRKYRNMKHSSRVSMFFDNRSSDIADLYRITALQAVGDVSELQQYAIESWRSIYLLKYPELSEFACSPENALMLMTVERFEIVTHFQGVSTLTFR